MKMTTKVNCSYNVIKSLNNVNLRYSYMANIKSVINMHNKEVIKSLKLLWKNILRNQRRYI